MSEYVNLEYFKDYFQLKHAPSLNAIEDFCKISNVPISDRKNTFINKNSSIEEEEILLKKQLSHFDYGSYTVCYRKLYEQSLKSKTFSYYQYFVIRGSTLDLKKIFKISKLKAFL